MKSKISFEGLTADQKKEKAVKAAKEYLGDRYDILIRTISTRGMKEETARYWVDFVGIYDAFADILIDAFWRPAQTEV